jgi:hypothetical protein
MSLIADTRIILLNSLYSTPQKSNGTYQKTFLSNVLFNTNGVLENANNILYSTIGIDSCAIAHSFYNINYTNNTLIIQVPVTLVKYTINLRRGHYNIKQLLLELERKINATLFYVVKSLTFDRISGGLSLVLDKDFVFLSSPLGSTALETLGFDNVRSYASTNFTLVSEQGVSLIGPKYIKVVSNSLQTNCLSAQSDGSFHQQSILGVIPINSGEYSLITYNNSNDRDPILINTTVNQIDISLMDENSNFLNMNNVEWSLVLRLTSYRNIEFKNAPSITQLIDTATLGKSQVNVEESVKEYNDLDMLLYQMGVDV